MLFFLVCFLIYHFKWSKNKSFHFLKSKIRDIEFSEKVNAFVTFFENKIKQKNKLSSRWSETAEGKVDIVIVHTFLNQTKGIGIDQQPHNLKEEDSDYTDNEREEVILGRKVNLLV